MEHSSRPRDAERATPAHFASWLRERLEERGYDLRPRGGGQSKFAADSGLGAGTISRILNAQAATETRVLQTISEALNVPLPEVLVASGVLTRSELNAVQRTSPQPRRAPLTPEAAAAELGISDPQARAVFVSMTKTLRQQRAENGGKDNAAEN
ncbi:helix-turn-helix domain-containing protein [Streptomyces noursei]|uniref:helix-turn-helix domain-containing protein n=1 Tax=Streptomyces noursei TaxID=1971 RepID=UPI0023B7DC0E|nr:helix-turn-helix transcriptional regulator [Streptomyces noursei]